MVELELEGQKYHTETVYDTLNPKFENGKHALECKDALTDVIRLVCWNNDGEEHTEKELGAVEFEVSDICFSK